MNLGTQILLNNALDCLRRQELDIALELLKKAKASDPNNSEIFRLLAVVAALKFQFSDALDLINRAISINPVDVMMHSNKGNILKELGRYEDALLSLDKAIQLDSSYAEAYSNKGNVLQEIYQYEQALICYDRAITLQPEFADVYSNKGNALGQLQRHREGIICHDKATSLNPRYVDAYWNKAMTQLRIGDYKEGWQNYEARWSKSCPIQFQYGHIPRLENIENLQKKKVLIWAEQGLGDTFQFCRYIKLLHARGALVTFIVPTTLLNVLESLKSYCVFTDSVDCSQIHFDFQSPLLSLPLVFNTTIESIPATIPYLVVNSEKSNFFKADLLKNNLLKVGLVWNGGYRVNRPELWAVNQRRNIEFELMAHLRGISGISFYGLQKGDPAESELLEKQPVIWPELINYAPLLQDFSDTAALIENLDLVVCVDTSTAHLAGALGKPIWILNRFDSCWRWLYGATDSPWYPTAKIYQQLNPGDWGEVIQKVVNDLEKFKLDRISLSS
jgi:Tfp pilus assembly protein PilF